MAKLSKSDLPDSQDETRAALERLLHGNRCKHFAVGTYMWHNQRRAKVIDHLDKAGFLLVEFDDDAPRVRTLIKAPRGVMRNER